VVNSLADGINTYLHMPLTNDFSNIDNFSAGISKLQQFPELNKFVGLNMKQPQDQLAMIADYTNSFRSLAASTCDSAIDYLLLDKKGCPNDANFLENLSLN